MSVLNRNEFVAVCTEYSYDVDLMKTKYIIWDNLHVLFYCDFILRILVYFLFYLVCFFYLCVFSFVFYMCVSYTALLA